MFPTLSFPLPFSVSTKIGYVIRLACFCVLLLLYGIWQQLLATHVWNKASNNNNFVGSGFIHLVIKIKQTDQEQAQECICLANFPPTAALKIKSTIRFVIAQVHKSSEKNRKQHCHFVYKLYRHFLTTRHFEKVCREKKLYRAWGQYYPTTVSTNIYRRQKQGIQISN